jgi:mono/diheme cytochrome c family protein
MPWMRPVRAASSATLVVCLLIPGQAGLAGQVTAARAGLAAPAGRDTGAAAARALLTQYCVSCHNTQLKTAGLALDTIDLADVGPRADIWEKVIRKLRARSMPPLGRPRPDASAVTEVVSWLASRLDQAADATPRVARTEAVHRLNRAEYQNAIRDLLAVDLDLTASLPADDAGKHGFDNAASVLSVSPVLFERYLSTARTISALAVGIAPTGAVVDTYENPKHLQQDDQTSENLPFGSIGGLAVRHHFPVDGEYEIKVTLQRNYVEYPRGVESAHQLDVRLDGVLQQRLVVGGAGAEKGKAAPLSYAGNIYGDPKWEEWVLHVDDNLKARFKATAGPHEVGVSFVRQHAVSEVVPQPVQTAIALAVNEVPEGHPGVDRITITGPFAGGRASDTPSRARIFTCRPLKADEEAACARTILTSLARRAYRRAAAPKDVDTLVAFFRTGRRSGSFDEGVQLAIERLLVDPDFLFRIEREPARGVAGRSYQLTDTELASRLSFFIWSSIPDDELLTLAERGRLRDPAVLEGQVRRMLADPRTDALIENFVGQWLLLRNVRHTVVDPVAYPGFDDNLRGALEEETRLFVTSQLREDRGVPDLLAADYTFVNERLARHYGIPGVHGSRFRRVTLGPNDHRGGLLGQGALHLVTSHPDRTSPVLRGKWLLENILGTPPPPPPPNVPALPDRRARGGPPRSVRQRLEQHRSNPVCAACHAPMDPLGFALEHFDVTGRWRDTDGGLAIDARGALPDGTSFVGLDGLRAELLEHPEQFVETVTEKLLMYALGRPLEAYEMPSTRAITRRAAAGGYRWSDVVIGIVRSVPFQMRTVHAPAANAIASAASDRQPQREKR